MLVWPTADQVLGAAAAWAQDAALRRRDVLHIGFFGSYATGRAGVGSDLDLVVVLDESREPFERRGTSWDTTRLPVPVDLLVYTRAEWQAMMSSDRGFHQMLRDQTRWLFLEGAVVPRSDDDQNLLEGEVWRPGSTDLPAAPRATPRRP